MVISILLGMTILGEMLNLNLYLFSRGVLVYSCLQFEHDILVLMMRRTRQDDNSFEMNVNKHSSIPTKYAELHLIIPAYSPS